MSDTHQEAEVTRGELTKAGWRQGALFSLPAAHLLWNGLPEECTDSGVVTIEYAEVTDDELLIVATQDCDIDARGATEPYIEALVCRVTTDANILRAAQRNSSRWFIVDPKQGLVTYAMDRLQVDKRTLRSLSPQPWPSSDEHFIRFRRWLTRRYDRPAIPDPIVEAFQRPINSRMNRLEKQQPSILETFSNVVSELRITVPTNVTPPYPINVLLVTERLKITEDEAEAIDRVRTEFESAVDPTQATIEEWRLLHPEEISVANYFATIPMHYDYLTYHGDEVVGAMPLSET